MPKCEHPYNFFGIALRHGCSPVNFLHIFRTSFPKNISGQMLLTAWLTNNCSTYIVQYLEN